jgi:hypothetical protein
VIAARRRARRGTTLQIANLNLTICGVAIQIADMKVWAQRHRGVDAATVLEPAELYTQPVQQVPSLAQNGVHIGESALHAYPMTFRRMYCEPIRVCFAFALV